MPMIGCGEKLSPASVAPHTRPPVKKIESWISMIRQSQTAAECVGQRFKPEDKASLVPFADIEGLIVTLRGQK